MGLNAALSIAGRSLEFFSAGIQVSGNNISNAGNPDYIREQLELRSSFPTQQGGLIFGSGAVPVGIRQQIDKYLERRIYTANSDYFGADARNSIAKQLESALQELGDNDFSSQLNELVGTFNDLVNQPEVPANRELVVRQGQQFSQAVVDLRTRLDRLRGDFNVNIGDLVTEANRLIDRIADLNPQITSLEASGLLRSDAGGLRADRYAALNRLSQIIPIRTIEHETGGVDVFLGDTELVIPGRSLHLETVPTVDRGTVVHNVRVEGTFDNISGTQGELNGLMHGRDQITGGFLDKFDQLTSSLILEVNRIHSSGQGTTGFTSVTGTYGVNDVNASLDAAGLTFPPEHGSFEVRVRNTTTGAIQTSQINIDLDGIGANTTLTDVIAQINGVANLSATVTSDRRLQISAGSGYQVEFAADSSGALAALGINTFFSGTSSRDIAVNSQLTQDPRLLATSLGGGPADGRNAAQLAAVADKALSGLANSSVTDFYQTMLSGLAQSSASEQAVSTGFKGFRESLLDQRAQRSGVSLDEETIQIMQYQRAYQVSARFISTIDQLFTALLQI